MPINESGEIHRQSRDLSVCVSVRLRAEDKKNLALSAEAKGVSVSEYLRSVALQESVRTQRKRLPSAEEECLARLVGQLGNISSQLRRIFPGDKAQDIQPLMNQLRHVINRLVEVSL